MSVHAGSILTVGGNNVIDRVQSAGLGDANVPVDTIREVGNRLVVDKVPQEPDFTFTLESLDVSTDLMAFLTGKVGAQAEATSMAFTAVAATDLITSNAHGLADTTRVRVSDLTGVAGLVAGTIYFVRDSTPNTLKLAATSGGAAIDITSDGSGTIRAISGAPGDADAVGTEYKWEDCGYVNIVSPWKDPASGATGNIVAGHLVPAFYPTRLQYQLGVTDNAQQTVELAGGSFYYGKAAPVEEYATGDAATVAFASANTVLQYRLGGAAGTTFRHIFGVLVAGIPMQEGVDYTVNVVANIATITFTVAPANGALVRYCYFTGVAKTYPQTVHASTVTKPGAVRGRNIPIYLGTGGSRQRLASVQSITLEATTEGEVEREMGTEDPVGRSVTGTDCTGTITVRSKNAAAFIALLSKVTGVADTEVFGFINQNPIALEIPILNPKNVGQVLKTLYVSDAIFQPPGTPARVNTPTDFVLNWTSKNGTFSEFKGAKP